MDRTLPGGIGKLRQRVTIEKNVPTKAGDGQEVESWKLLAANVPAEVIGLMGQEVARGEQMTALVTSQVTIRFRDDVTPLMRLKHQGRVLNILRTFDPQGRRRKLVMMCGENA